MTHKVTSDPLDIMATSKTIAFPRPVHQPRGCLAPVPLVVILMVLPSLANTSWRCRASLPPFI